MKVANKKTIAFLVKGDRIEEENTAITSLVYDFQQMIVKVYNGGNCTGTYKTNSARMDRIEQYLNEES